MAKYNIMQSTTLCINSFDKFYLFLEFEFADVDIDSFLSKTDSIEDLTEVSIEGKVD